MHTAQAYSAFVEALAAYNGDFREAAATARIVFEDIFGITAPETDARPFAPAQQQQLAAVLERLRANEPVQYIAEKAFFYDFFVRVSPAVLIPRPETEELVELGREYLRSARLEQPRVLDIGTGSGCIPLAFKRLFPKSDITALDISPAALALAAQSAADLRLEIHWREADILAEATDEQDWGARFELIASNPPYIPPSERPKMSESTLRHEPELALFVPENDPLCFYRAVARFSARHLRESGCIILELNEFHAEATRELYRDLGWDAELRRDLRGCWRMLQAKR